MQDVIAALVSLFFLISIISFAIYLGVVNAQELNEYFELSDSFCKAHPEVEMWQTPKGTLNCSIMREGKMVAI